MTREEKIDIIDDCRESIVLIRAVIALIQARGDDEGVLKMTAAAANMATIGSFFLADLNND